METSSEQLGRILGEKEKELSSGMERRCQKVKALKPCRDFTWPKIIFGIDRYHCKNLSTLYPGPSSDRIIFFCHAADF